MPSSPERLVVHSGTEHEKCLPRPRKQTRWNTGPGRKRSVKSWHKSRLLMAPAPRRPASFYADVAPRRRFANGTFTPTGARLQAHHSWSVAHEQLDVFRSHASRHARLRGPHLPCAVPRRSRKSRSVRACGSHQGRTPSCRPAGTELTGVSACTPNDFLYPGWTVNGISIPADRPRFAGRLAFGAGTPRNVKARPLHRETTDPRP